MLYDAVLAKKMAAELLERGIYVIGFFYPVVPKGEARIRVQISAAMEIHQLDEAVDVFTEVGQKLNVLTPLKDFLEKRAVILTLVILGIMLSYGHQSSLGGLFLIAPTKLHPLYYTNIIHHLFFLSAICAGLSMVSCETIISANMRNTEYESEILEGLARGSAIALWVYFLVRIIDLALKGKLVYVFEGTMQSHLFLLEMGVGVVLPMLLLTSRTVRRSIPLLLFSHGLVVFGVILNRFDAVFLTEASMRGPIYLPSWEEVFITLGLVSTGILFYKIIVTYLPIFNSPSTTQQV
jgi:Ni/Fe-hydrogenase subunit HybB-like protein